MVSSTLIGAPPPGRSASKPTPIVATLFYNIANPVHAHPHPDTSPHPLPNSPLPSASLSSLKDGASVPTDDIEKYPLEPPTPGPNPLDHLYGAYVSQGAINEFETTIQGILKGNGGRGKEQESIDEMTEDAQKGQDEWTFTIRPLERSKYPRVVEVHFPLPASSPVTLESLRRSEQISRFERAWNVEVVFQIEGINRRYKRLAVFDMDSTLIQQEVIDEIASLINVEAEVSAITAAAMNGELDFEQSLRKRCALLKGVPSSVWETLKPRITLNDGVKDLITALKKLGYKTAVLSGGFTPLTGWMAGQLGLDYAFANHLVVSEDGTHLTGELTGEIVHAERKRQHVLEIAAKEGVQLEQVLVVGDGANDLPMMGVAGLGVAWNAKAKVQMLAPARLNGARMTDVLYLLGVGKEEQEDLIR